MEATLQEFAAVIGEQNQLLDQISALGEEKQQVIIRGQVKELDRLIHKEALLISNLDKLESKRFQLQQQVSFHWGGSMVPARELVEWAGQEYPLLKNQLAEAVERIGYNLARLKAINDHNHELIEQSLHYIETMQAVLNGDSAGTYSDKGDPVDEKMGRQINLLDTRA